MDRFSERLRLLGIHGTADILWDVAYLSSRGSRARFPDMDDQRVFQGGVIRPVAVFVESLNSNEMIPALSKSIGLHV